MKKIYFLFTLFAASSLMVSAQEFGSRANAFMQAMDSLSMRQSGSVDSLKQVTYQYYVVKENTRLQARLNYYTQAGIWQGNFDDLKNEALLQLINRNDLSSIVKGDTLILPSRLDLDVRSYSPFAWRYEGAKNIDKLIVLDKSSQAFGAYERGELVRWGRMNTGNNPAKTPEGRFNVNWKAEVGISSISPGLRNPKKSDEMWEMRWIMNIHAERGIHIHQMDMEGLASHGCIRVHEGNAHWLYDWTQGWEKTTENQKSCAPEDGCQVTKQGTMVLVLGPNPPKVLKPFRTSTPTPELKMVRLPLDPYSVPAGTHQQRKFDGMASAKN
jgi:hypothetical protein